MEIYIDILKAVGEGRQKPTHIMYRANLTWTRLTNYLGVLVDRKLLTEKEADGPSTYSLTATGKEVVRYYKRIELQTRQGKKVRPPEVRLGTH